MRQGLVVVSGNDIIDQTKRTDSVYGGVVESEDQRTVTGALLQQNHPEGEALSGVQRPVYPLMDALFIQGANVRVGRILLRLKGHQVLDL